MNEQLFRVTAQHKETGEKITLQVWARSVDEATGKLTGALFGSGGAYLWIGSSPEHKDGEVVRR